MKQAMFMSLLFLLPVSSAFAHQGHLHTYMGTVTMLHDDGSFMMNTTAGKGITVKTSAQTTYVHADDRAATRNDLAVGMRVVVKMAADGTTAVSVKMSGPGKERRAFTARQRERRGAPAGR